MKMAILSCNPKCYSTRRLREAAKQRGHTVKVRGLDQGIPRKAEIPVALIVRHDQNHIGLLYCGFFDLPNSRGNHQRWNAQRDT